MNTDAAWKVLHWALAEHMRLRTFVDVCAAGLHVATDARQSLDVRREVAEVLRDPDPFPDPEEFEKHALEAQRIQSFARDEAATGFPYLFAIATVRLWGLLEHAVDDVVAALLATTDGLPADSVVVKLEGPLLFFLSASPEERAEYLAAALKEKVKAGLRPGVGRFDALLEPLGLAGGVPDEIRRVILELSNVRHVIVHRSGVVDKRLVAACPWLGWPVGTPICLGRSHFTLYSLTVDWYFLELSARLLRAAGTTRNESESRLQDLLLQRVQEFLRSRAEVTRGSV